MQRAFYQASLNSFLGEDVDTILGGLTRRSDFAVEENQRAAWLFQIEHLQVVLQGCVSQYPEAAIYFEYAIPRMGRRIDVVLVMGGVVFVLEYKVGDAAVLNSALDQVTDYALDLKHFHESSHTALIAPVLIPSDCKWAACNQLSQPKNDGILQTVAVGPDALMDQIGLILRAYPQEMLTANYWEQGRYQPTPTIVEAARALYAGHNVQDLSRSDAGAINLAQTSKTVEQVIAESRAHSQKAICFVTGVPGAGKTLVGLNIATSHIDPDSDLYSVFLSGNGPLVNILHEALARDRVDQARKIGKKLTKATAKSEVKAFIQNVHHFRDDGLKDISRPPVEHVALFDEAQRAWDLRQTVDFMKRKKGRPDFKQSEPSFLISCMERHPDWAVVVCLVGGGQEINRGEAGIAAWLDAVREEYPHWQVFASPNLSAREYQAKKLLDGMSASGRVNYRSELHLSISMRSFRAEKVSAWVKAVLDGELEQASNLYNSFRERYPIVLTRDFDTAKAWTKAQARGSERYGLIVSSQAQRLKPYAVDVRSPMDPLHWFLNDKDDVRSSYYLEDVATEFQVQGLELDRTCVAWDADFRRTSAGWDHFSFRGNKWQNIHQEHNRRYQLNAYRVLLTRARQGMVIVIPEGSTEDHTRNPSYYNDTYAYLRDVGLEVI